MVGNEDGLSFGLDQLDGLSLGKLQRGSMGLLMGPSGTGKSTVLAHFLFDGAKHGEGCCMLTNEPPARMVSWFSAFRSFDATWVKEGYISIFNLHDMLDRIGISEEDATPDDMELLFDLLVQTIEQMDVRRLAIDPLNPLVKLTDRAGKKFFMRELRNEVIERGIVALSSYDSNDPSTPGGPRSLEPDIFDVTIAFSRVIEGASSMNCLSIEKWRGAPHSRATYVIDIDQEGVVLVPKLGSGGLQG